jgi:hypothetical protein
VFFSVLHAEPAPALNTNPRRLQIQTFARARIYAAERPAMKRKQPDGRADGRADDGADRLTDPAPDRRADGHPDGEPDRRADDQAADDRQAVVCAVAHADAQTEQAAPGGANIVPDAQPDECAIGRADPAADG